MNELNEVMKEIIAFRDERDWQQFHNSKDLAIAINSEAAELLNLFLWKNSEDVSVDRLKEELADILIFCLYMADKHQLDVKQIILDKIQMNQEKYPANKSRGSATKYTDL